MIVTSPWDFNYHWGKLMTRWIAEGRIRICSLVKYIQHNNFKQAYEQHLHACRQQLLSVPPDLEDDAAAPGEHKTAGQQ